MIRKWPTSEHTFLERMVRMNDISRAMEKKRAEKAKHRYAVGAESGADWGLT